ncbi:MAG: hypothetical protein ACTSUE_07355 [Promethearchaeota archaeon]
MSTISVTDPSNPATEFHESVTTIAYDLDIEGDVVYIADGASGLLVLNISNPDNPSPLGSETTSGEIRDVFVDGDYVYMAAWDQGLAVSYVADPTNPGAEVYENATGNARGVFVSGNYAYVACDDQGLAIFDISNPANPGAPVYSNTTGTANAVFIAGNYAYIACGTSGLAVIDISDPTNPGSPVYEDTTGNALDVYISGNYAFIADDTSGLAIMDVSDPTDPGAPVYEDTDTNAGGVVVAGDYAYVADYNGLDSIKVKTCWYGLEIPSTPTVSSDYNGVVDINWADVTGATEYFIYRDTSPITTMTGLTPIATSLTSDYQDTVGSNNTYYYAVAAGNGRSKSFISNDGSDVVQIDGTAPKDFTLVTPSGWIMDQTPDVVISFTSDLSGVNVSTVQFAYSTSGSATPTNWAAVDGVYEDAGLTNPAEDGDTGTLYARILAVPFNQDSGTLNRVRIQATDIAGNTGVQGTASNVQIDSSAATSFNILQPTSWVTDTTPTVTYSFVSDVSGVDVSTVQFAYSTSGSATPTNWAVVDGVYEDAGLTNPAEDGDTGTLYARILAVPFNQNSGSLNTIRIRSTDMTGNTGTQAAADVIQIDSSIPSSFALSSPGSWTQDQTPDVIFQFDAGSTSGVDVSLVEFAYSTTGSLTPTNWATVDGVYTDAGCTTPAGDGVTGSLYALITNVPFNQDSGSLNTARLRATNMAGTTGTQSAASNVQIDSTAPDSISVYSPGGWVTDQTPDVIFQFSTATSGVDVSTVQWAFSTTGSTTPTNWATVGGVYTDAGCTTTASDGDTGTLFARITGVPFNQDSATQNTIRLQATDMAGNTAIQSSASTIAVDSTAPSVFVLNSPTGWISFQLTNVVIQFNTSLSGVDVSSVEFAFSTTGELAPTNWAAIDSIYTDSALTTSATDGDTGTLYAYCSDLNFGQDSSNQNTVRIRVTDMAGNTGIQATAFMIQIDSTIDVIPSLTASPPSCSSINSFNVNWTNPSDLSGVVAAYYKIGIPESMTDGIRVNGTDIQSISGITLPSAGIYEIHVWTVDAAGNSNYADSVNVSVCYQPVQKSKVPNMGPLFFGFVTFVGVISVIAKKKHYIMK